MTDRPVERVAQGSPRDRPQPRGDGPTGRGGSGSDGDRSGSGGGTTDRAGSGTDRGERSDSRREGQGRVADKPEQDKFRPVTRVIVVTGNDKKISDAKGVDAKYRQQDVWNAAANHIKRNERAPGNGDTKIVYVMKREQLEQKIRQLNAANEKQRAGPVQRIDFVGHGTPNSAVLSASPKREINVEDMGKLVKNARMGRDGAPVEVNFRTCMSDNNFVTTARKAIEAEGISNVTVRGNSHDFEPEVKVNGKGAVVGVTANPRPNVVSRSVAAAEAWEAAEKARQAKEALEGLPRP